MNRGREDPISLPRPRATVQWLVNHPVTKDQIVEHLSAQLRGMQSGLRTTARGLGQPGLTPWKTLVPPARSVRRSPGGTGRVARHDCAGSASGETP